MSMAVVKLGSRGLNDVRESYMGRVITFVFAMLVLLLFTITELVVITSFNRFPMYDLFAFLQTKYFVAFLVALPTFTGIKGYYSVKRHVASSDTKIIQLVQLQFAIGIIAADSALIICIGELTKIFQIGIK